jgi:uncharacterized RDD family membrane protein YckC/tetratricopeptide (TPR) repeat protein
MTALTSGDRLAAPIRLASLRAAVDAPKSADVGRRILAGLVDLTLLAGLGLLCSIGPLFYGGAALPMIGSVVAIAAYAIVPASMFGATPGMALAGIRLRSIKGGTPDVTEVAFRELVGRGLIGAAYFMTGAIGLAGYLTGYLQFFVPRGLGLFLFGVSGLLVLFSLLSHFSIMLRPDGRALHDLLTRTIVVPKGETVVDPAMAEDEDAASFAAARTRARFRNFVFAEVLLIGLGAGLPMFVGRTEMTAGDLEDRVALRKAEKAFEKDRTDPAAVAELVALHHHAGRVELASTVEQQHRDAMKAAGLVPSDRDYLVQKYRALLKGTPCALGSAVELGERFIQLREYDRALELVAKLEAECGVRPRLWWIALTAHRELGELDLAIQDSTKLIASRPDDSDFWWWRGEDHAKKGNLINAEADFRQSLAVQADQFAATRFTELMKSKDRCEGIFALQHLIDENPEAAEGWVDSTLAELQLGASCADATGHGTAKLAIQSDASVRTTAIIAGKKGRFLVHPTGYVTITKSFADKVGLRAEGPTVELRIAEKVVPAQLALADRIAVDKSRADRVPVAVVGELPADIDGLLGLSYLWRFRVVRLERSLTFAPR